MGGQDKGLILMNGKPLIEYVIERFAPQVDELVISANRNLDCYRRYGYRVVPDYLQGFQGPLAGISAGLEIVSAEFAVSAATDAPFLPLDLVDRLKTALKAAQVPAAVARHGDCLEPLYAMIDTSCAANLRAFLETGQRKVRQWYQQLGMTTADFSDLSDAFTNINTPDDLSGASSIP